MCRERAQVQRIQALQRQIREVEVQQAVRQVQAKLLEVKIRQVSYACRSGSCGRTAWDDV